MSDVGFDIHEERHRLKQLEDSGDAKLFENRSGVTCPACGSTFSRLFLTRRTEASFPENNGARFCLVRDEEFLHLFRH